MSEKLKLRTGMVFNGRGGRVIVKIKARDFA